MLLHIHLQQLLNYKQIKMKTGRYSILQLFTTPEVEQIVIPELQRDYVWGERNVRGLLTSILNNYGAMESQTLSIKDACGEPLSQDLTEYLNEEYMRLRYNTRVGFIYAYHDRTLFGQYYLIDGQQRITTIFLVLLALYRRYDAELFRRNYFPSSIPKVDYKVRDTAHNFLVDFIEFELTKGKDSTATFKDDSRYYIEYDSDVTAQSLFANYYNVIVPALENLENYDAGKLVDYVENYIEFNYFDTNMSEQGEKLYLYMNSRGESLSAQERIKSVIVGRSTDKLAAGKEWEDWQNFFWRLKHEDDKNADRGFFEFIKWSVIIHICEESDSTIKQTGRRHREEIEDYIRIEKDESRNVRQADWICNYISENHTFTFEWLKKVEAATERLNEVLRHDLFKQYGFEADKCFKGYDNTIEYVVHLGSLYYIMLFNGGDIVNILRMAMYLRNLTSEYTLRRNPDDAVIRCLSFVKWVHEQGAKDIRSLNFTQYGYEDEKVCPINDKRYSYYEEDYKSGGEGKIGYWESFFWKITNKKELNDFLRGNYNFILRLWETGKFSVLDELLEKFESEVFEKRDNDDLRRNLLKHGNISVYDNGGSSNIGPNWMKRWCMLAKDADEKYWNAFMNVNKDSARLIADYLCGHEGNANNRVLEEIGNNLEYMMRKCYLRYKGDDGDQSHLRVILLRALQASKSSSRELCIQYLHKKITDSFVWEHNSCVVNFVSGDNGPDIMVDDRSKGYYIGIWYDWHKNGGEWFCRVGHEEKDLPKTVTEKFSEWNVGKANNFAAIYKLIYKEKIDDEYFAGADKALEFYNNIWQFITSNIASFS